MEKKNGLEAIYAAVTDQIIVALEKGVVPWAKPWNGEDRALRQNGKPYRGFNQLILGFVKQTREYKSNIWLTWNQIEAFGGQVKEEERKRDLKNDRVGPVNVIYWNWIDKKTVKGDPVPAKAQKIPIIRYYRVYNFDQTTGCKLPDRLIKAANPIEKPFSPIQKAQEIIDGFRNGPSIVHKEQRAYYRPAGDTINMPRPETFNSPEEYYSTLFHEEGHATGSKNRLDRDMGTICPFGSTNYSVEELTAEMTAAYLCGVAGIENKTIDNSAAPNAKEFESNISKIMNRRLHEKTHFYLRSGQLTFKDG